MNRLMYPALALMVTSLLSGSLMAGEAEEAATKKFLDAQTGVNESVLGTQELSVRMLQHDVGKISLTIEKGEYEGQPCYVLTTKGKISLGGTTELSGVSHIAPDLTLLHGEETENEDGELTKHELYTVKDGVLTAEFKQPKEDDETKREQTFKITQKTGLLMGSAELLVTLLLPRDADVTYEFIRWSSTVDKTYPLQIEAKGKATYGDKPAFRFVEHDKKFSEDELGNETSIDADNTFLFDAEASHKLLFMDSSDGFTLETGEPAKRTPITREMIEKQDNEKYVAAGFFLAAGEKDEALLKALLNEYQFVRDSLDSNPMTENASDEEKDAIAEMYKDTVVENILNSGGEEEKTEQEQAREKALTKLLLSAENFISEEKAGKQTVRFTDEAAKMFGKLLFILAKSEDGKWEITGIEPIADEDDAKDEDGEEKDNDEGEGKKDDGSAEEDGF
ncbi:MAG: hypothetical protein KDB29_04745 [Planctomycetes bacterium]|nr:hypothetical protein [Planctomycetota bacterium]